MKLWSDAWAEMVPFLSIDVEIRKVICSTNAIESCERPGPQGGSSPRPLPPEAAALKCLYMALSLFQTLAAAPR
ncbi:transposase [Streptomyces sp. 1222.5]|uniref:transposase n=1 Tax=Streptomyces sp. 1222.5 TaxID=1881026 RepID=UPI003EB6DA17